MIKEFECTDPSHEPVVFEKFFLNYTDYSLLCGKIPCPECNKVNNVKVLISKTAKPKFCGSGFYETDYKK